MNGGCDVFIGAKHHKQSKDWLTQSQNNLISDKR